MIFLRIVNYFVFSVNKLSTQLSLLYKRVFYSQKVNCYVPPGTINHFDPLQVMKGCRVSKNCILDSYTYVGYNSELTQTTVGKYSSIGNNVLIGLGKHDYNLISTSSYIHPCNDGISPNIQSTQIGHDVWVGSGVIVMCGVKIGNGAVIGAGSIVTKDVKAYSINIGVPSKLLKMRFSANQIEKIESTQWWNYEVNIARKIVKNSSLQTSVYS